MRNNKNKTDREKLEELQADIFRDYRYKIEQLEDESKNRRFRRGFIFSKKSIIELLTIPLVISIIYAILKNA